MARNEKPAAKSGKTFQEVITALSQFWTRERCVLALPYDLEVGAGTMCPETFLRVLGPDPWRVAYVQPARRPADGRYGENPNRLLKHTQMQVILKPPPGNIQEIYLQSLQALGINLHEHDIRFEEDNWEAPTLGAWGIGWQVVLDGLEITQFTYFQQCGGMDLDPISVELTYGIERIAAFLQAIGDVYEIRWNDEVSYGELRRAEELELSVYDFEAASPEACRALFRLYEAEALRLVAGTAAMDEAALARFPLRKAYDLCLKCSHLFNILDARGAISVTERIAMIGRVRKLACEIARIYLLRREPPVAPLVEAEPA
jgi:glycyl-tRNA synthetase alpha chain